MTSAELPSSLAASPPSSQHHPTELLAQIVEEAARDRVKLDYTTFRHLCLTSRSVLPFAQQAFYREISIALHGRGVQSPPDGKKWEDMGFEPDMDEAGGVAWD